MAVICSECGCASRDPEFCERCNTDLKPPPPVPTAKAARPDPDGALQPPRGQVQRLTRPEAAIRLHTGERGWRFHWIPNEAWPRWRRRVEERQTYQAPALPPCRVLNDENGVWVAAEAAVHSRPWTVPPGQDTLEWLHRVANYLDQLAAALQGLHEQGLVWLTFDPVALEEVDGRLRITNLDLAVYPAKQCPEHLRPLPAFAPPEVCRRQSDAIGPRTDVFHLALFAYYWLGRYLPHGFFGKGLAAFDFDLPPLRILRPRLAPGLAGAVAQGLAIDPGERPPTPGAWCAGVRAAVERATVRQRAASPIRYDIGFHTRTGRAKAARAQANEDCGFVEHLTDPERGLIVIADGVTCCDIGRGDIASQLTCEAFRSILGPDTKVESFSERAAAAARAAAEALLAWAVERDEHERLAAGFTLMGCTTLAAWVEGATLALANIGDSRAYLIDATGIDQLTVDGDLGSALLAAGSPPEEVVELGSAAASLQFYVGGCCRSRVGGLTVDTVRSKPQVSQCRLLAGDVVVLCSDGLVEEGVFLEPAELLRLVRLNAEAPAAVLAEKLAEAADARQRLPSAEEPEGFGDNITCSVIKVLGMAD
jgi:serine/threonine protein phosphatase PrpC